MVIIGLAIALAPILANAQTKPVVVVGTFSVAKGVPWPYDMKQLQAETIAELKVKDGKEFNVTAKSPKGTEAEVYTLQGKILSWHPGNKAKRLFVGLGSGREVAKIRYWLTNEKGKQVFTHTDTIRAAFWGNAYAGSVGQLAQPREHAHRLFFLGMHMRRQKAAQFVPVALRFGKAGAPVERRVAQQRKTGWHCLLSIGVGFFVH